MTNGLSLQEKVIKGSVIVLALTLLSSMFTYFIRVLYSRSLSLEDYGLFYAVFGFFSIISVHTDFGFGEAMVYFIPKYFKLKKFTQLWNTFIYGQVIQVVAALLISGILIFLAPYLSANYFKVVGSENLIYIFCIFLILNSVLNSLLQVFTGLQGVKYYSSINVLRSALTLFFSYVFLLLNLHNPLFYAIAWVFGYFITTVIFIYLLWGKHPVLTKNNLSWHKETFNVMFQYAVPAFATTFVYSLLVSSDIFLLTLFRGVKEVGIYNVVVPLASISIVLISPLNSILFPLVSHLYEGERKKLGYLVGKIYETIPFLGVYFALFIIMFPSSTAGLIFGQKWLGLVQLPLSILSMGYVALLSSNILGIIALGMGKVKERLKVLTVISIISVAFNIVLIRQFGVLGAVVTTSLFALASSLLFTKIIKSKVFFKIPYLFYLKLLLFSIFLFFIIRLSGFYPKNWFEFIVSGIVYTLTFIIFGYILKIYDKQLVELIIQRSKGQ